MILSILLLLAGLVLILGGASFLTDGGSALAKRWGVSELVIGLTIVAFGTSAPELSISVLAALKGNAGLAVGNIVGSNIFNILVIIGASALIRPLKVERTVMTNDIPLVILSSLAVLFAANGHLLDGTASDSISRSSGLIFLLFFAIFLRYTFALAKSPDAASAAESSSSVKEMAQWKAWVYIIGGLAALIGGGEMFVNGASAVARALGVNDSLIGLTIVAFGTSAPELATSIMAAWKGRVSMAIGNVAGSCLFNVFLILGVSASITPLGLDGIGNVDLLVLLASSVIFYATTCFYKDRTITRAEGALMLVGYAAYMYYLIAAA